MIMDIWTVLSFDESWNLLRYGTALLASFPVTAEYAVSNVIFLMLMFRPFGEGLNASAKTWDFLKTAAIANYLVRQFHLSDQ